MEKRANFLDLAWINFSCALSPMFPTVVPNDGLLRSWDGEFGGAVGGDRVFNGGGGISGRGEADV